METRSWIRLKVAALVKDVDAKKTITTDEELNFVCKVILKDHPTLKLEEIAVCFDNIRAGRYGPLYERLKGAEILLALRKYEGEERAEVLERINTQDRSWEQQLRKLPWAGRATEFLKEINGDAKTVGKIAEGLGSRLRTKLGTDDDKK